MSREKIFLPVPDLKLKDLLDWQVAEQRKHRKIIHAQLDTTNRQSLVERLVSSQSQSTHKKCFGKSIVLNDKSIALFRIGREVYASQSECPHAEHTNYDSEPTYAKYLTANRTIVMKEDSAYGYTIYRSMPRTDVRESFYVTGGPLYLADIEEIVPGQVCLKCPSHKWKFDIDTGNTVHPMGRNTKATMYPVRVDEDDNIFIGFDSLGPSAFRTSF